MPEYLSPYNNPAIDEEAVRQKSREKIAFDQARQSIEQLVESDTFSGVCSILKKENRQIIIFNDLNACYYIDQSGLCSTLMPNTTIHEIITGISSRAKLTPQAVFDLIRDKVDEFIAQTEREDN